MTKKKRLPANDPYEALYLLLDLAVKRRAKLLARLRQEKTLAAVAPDSLAEAAPSWEASWEFLFRWLPGLLPKLRTGGAREFLSAVRKKTQQAAPLPKRFQLLVASWILLPEIMAAAAGDLPVARRTQALQSGDGLWRIGLQNMLEGFASYTDRLLHEKSLESAVLFHTTQTVTTELDLNVLLNKVVLHAGMLIQNKQVYLFLAEPKPLDARLRQRLYLRASNQPFEAYGEYSLQVGEGLVGETAETRLPIIDNAYRNNPKKIPWLKDAACLLAVPICFGSEVLGVLLAATPKSQEPFTTDDQMRLTMYSQQIAVNFKNLLLYQQQAQNAQELEEKNQMLESQADMILRKSAQLEVLNEVSQQVNSSLELKEVLNLVARQAAQSIGLDRGVVWLLSGPVTLEAVAAFGLPAKFLANLNLDLPAIRDTALFRTFSERVSTTILSGQDEELFVQKLHGYLTPKAMLACPLVFKDESIGLLVVDDTREAHEFLDDEIGLVMSVANHAVMAIENARLFQKVKEQAITDGLTGVYNHRFFQLRFADEFAHCRRYGNDMSLIMMDIDHFKHYNDTYGHVAGDLALKEIANLTRASVRENDLVARYGGEEFAIILPMTNLGGAQVVAERIRQSIQECRFLGDVHMPQVGMTVSLGVASYGQQVQSREELVRQADAALYEAKAQGRNRCIYFKPKPAEGTDTA
ncbi:MAG: diguanylate cyclase [candidate division FCPU426 bacterium]